MSDQGNGLYNKYQIINRETGQEAEGQYFVLKPVTDPAARAALMAYAEATDNQQLAMDIMVWLSSLPELAKCEWSDEGRQRSQGKEQCEGCGDWVPAPELQSLWRDGDDYPISACHTCYSDAEEEKRGEDLRDAGERDPRELI